MRLQSISRVRIGRVLLHPDSFIVSSLCKWLHESGATPSESNHMWEGAHSYFGPKFHLMLQISTWLFMMQRSTRINSHCFSIYFKEIQVIHIAAKLLQLFSQSQLNCFLSHFRFITLHSSIFLINSSLVFVELTLHWKTNLLSVFMLFCQYVLLYDFFLFPLFVDL